jgi:hypothetical protein
MSAKIILTAIALAAATFASSVLDAVQAARLESSPVTVAGGANLAQIAGFKLPSPSRYAGGVGHTTTTLPMPPRCTGLKLPLPGFKHPHP